MLLESGFSVYVLALVLEADIFTFQHTL